MKTYLLSLLFALCISPSFSQITFTTTTDEFTGAKKTKSDWITVCETMKLSFYVSYFETDNIYFLNIKYMITGGKITTIHTDDYLYLKLSDSSIIKLNPIESVVSCKGCGTYKFTGSSAYGLDMFYKIQYDDIVKLAISPVVKIRLEYDNDNYYLDQEINPNKAENLKVLFNEIKTHIDN